MDLIIKQYIMSKKSKENSVKVDWNDEATRQRFWDWIWYEVPIFRDGVMARQELTARLKKESDHKKRISSKIAIMDEGLIDIMAGCIQNLPWGYVLPPDHPDYLLRGSRTKEESNALASFIDSLT